MGGGVTTTAATAAATLQWVRRINARVLQLFPLFCPQRGIRNRGGKSGDHIRCDGPDTAHKFSLSLPRKKTSSPRTPIYPMTAHRLPGVKEVSASCRTD